jgi:hypothetical protein
MPVGQHCPFVADQAVNERLLLLLLACGEEKTLATQPST